MAILKYSCFNLFIFYRKVLVLPPVWSNLNRSIVRNADVAKLADAPDLGSGAARHVGSTPIIRTH
jgi:hypothetical protein